MRLPCRSTAVVVTAVALLMFGSATAYSAWARQATLSSAATLQAGTMALTPTWTTAPVLTELVPGSSRSGLARLTHSGQGRWVWKPAAMSTGPFGANLSVQVFETWTGSGATLACSGTAVPQNVVPAAVQAAPLAAGSATSVCVRFTLAGATAQTGLPVSVPVPPTAPNVVVGFSAESRSTK
jgi:hypothetical protein